MMLVLLNAALPASANHKTVINQEGKKVEILVFLFSLMIAVWFESQLFVRMGIY